MSRKPTHFCNNPLGAPMKEQEEAIAWVEAMGGFVYRGDDLDDDGKQILCFGIGQTAMPRHRVAAGFSVHSPIIRVDIASNNRITDVTPLGRLKKLRTLNLAIPKVTDLSPLANLVDLRELGLVALSVSDMSPIGSLTKLQKLDPLAISTSDLRFLTNLTDIRMLNMSCPGVSDLSPLQDLMSLEALTLVLSRRSIADLAPLQHLVSLREFWLCNTTVSNLSPLASLSKLRELHLDDTNVPNEEIAKLRKALPTCRIDQ